MLSEMPKYLAWQENRLKKKTNPLKALNISKYKKSDTIFILGSGSSINELNKDQWEMIKKHDSFGINFWLIHSHVPTYYMFESGEDKERYETLIKLLQLKKHQYSHVPFIIKNIENPNLDLNPITEELRLNFYSGYELVIPGRLESSLHKSIKLIKKFKILELQNIFLFKRASLSQALSFSLKAGYKNIVFCGVDLNNINYFYENDDYKNKNIPIPKKIQSESVHKTISETYGQITINKVILSLNNYLLKPNDIKLYIGSTKSALYPNLPYYFANIEHETTRSHLPSGNIE